MDLSSALDADSMKKKRKIKKKIVDKILHRRHQKPTETTKKLKRKIFVLMSLQKP